MLQQIFEKITTVYLLLMFVCLFVVCGDDNTDTSFKTVLDISYVSGGTYPDNKDKLDLYIPDQQGPFPVLIFIHGGGFVIGDKQVAGFTGERFASRGIATAVVNYRLSPGVSHPAHVQDAAAAFAWIYENIGKYGGDPGRIFVMGHSAGAYLTALLAADGSYLAEHNLTPNLIRGVISVSGFFHVERVAPDKPETIWGSDEEIWHDASPAVHAGEDFPPVLLLYAQHDTPARRKESEDFAQLLRDAENETVVIQEIAERDHNSIWLFMRNPGDEAFTAVLEFISEFSGE